MKRHINDTVDNKRYAVEVTAAQLVLFDKDGHKVIVLAKNIPKLVFTPEDRIALFWNIQGDKWSPPSYFKRLKRLVGIR